MKVLPGPLGDRAVTAIQVRDLSFTYPGAARSVWDRLSFALSRGARCLLLGANGVGKSTLLRLIAGRHLIPPQTVRVLGRPAFQDTSLAADVAFLGGAFPFSQDISVAEILARRPGIDPARRARALRVLDVDPAWRMHQVSDGQRRRVQILLDLERGPQVVLLDEVTADLDVLARADLLSLLREESERRDVTVVYASHVLDGLQAWGTHLLFMSPGRVRCFGRLEEIAELTAEGAALGGSAGGPSPLQRLCERWMRDDRSHADAGRPDQPW
jgi:CCR4-NOT complex subunit CAF16